MIAPNPEQLDWLWRAATGEPKSPEAVQLNGEVADLIATALGLTEDRYWAAVERRETREELVQHRDGWDVDGQ